MTARISNKYNHLFQRFSLEFFGPDFDWQWFKFQAIAESTLNPAAVSPAGAVGLMQLMPGTSAEMAIKLNIPDCPLDPEFNIRAGICYDRSCYNIWKQESGIERLRFMFASYNAGAGNIIKAQRLATFKNKWAAVSAQLPKITGRHAEETINYVRRIETMYGPV